jgi:hypothetical protein
MSKKLSVIPDALMVKAMNLQPGEVLKLFFDPMNASKACDGGLTYLEKRVDVLETKYPGFDLDELRGLPELCKRVSKGQRAVEMMRGVRTINAVELTAIALAWRRKLMPIAESLAANGKVDGKTVARIRSGSGNVDNVQDVIDLVPLLKRFEATVTETCGEGALASAEAAANEALEAMGHRPIDREALLNEADLRDRYATLIVRGHDRLRAAVAALSSFSNAEFVVTPLSNHGARTAGETPAPVVTPAP